MTDDFFLPLSLVSGSMENAAGRTESPRLIGLSTTDVNQRMAAGAVNRVVMGPTRTVTEIVQANVFTVFNLMLGVLLVVILFVAPPQDALFGLVLFTNALIGIVQELRAKRTLDRLALLSAPKAVVIRSDQRWEVPVDEVVLDDLLVTSPGDQIVVDGVVVQSEGLEVDESLLTGESDPITKELADEVLSGSFVSAGSGIYKARRVGADAYAATLAEEARKFTLVRSELRRGIDWILKTIAWLMLPMMGLLAWSQAKANDELSEAIRVAVAGMVAMIPQGLVLLTSVAFAVGVVRLGRHRVLVQELPAVEGLARVDVICFDKTGTLTEGRLAVDEVRLLQERDDAVHALGALGTAETSPNATMRAIADKFTEPVGWWRTELVPFSSVRKWSAAGFGNFGSWVIGAPEMILPNDREVGIAADSAAAEGKRVLLLAHTPEKLTGEILPHGLVAVAIVLLSDVVRDDAANTLRYFAEQGVATKVISGDHPETVASIAGSVGLLTEEDQVVDARNLPEDDASLIAVTEQGKVFGRVTPHQKRAMIGALQARGHVVAMTGDGVNDVLALKDADLGIAMGSGSSAARSVAQLVLLDGSFDTLPLVVGEGRRVIANIERVANLFVTKTVYALLLAVLVVVFARSFPFVPRHLTLVGTLTIGAPGFFLALAPTSARARPGFVVRVLQFAVPVGALAAIATYAAYELAIAEEVTLLRSRTLATLVLVSIGLFALILNSRPLTPGRRVLTGGMAGIFGLILLTPSWRVFFELEMPRLVLVLAGIGIIGITGGVMYGTLRAFGWLKQVPTLLRTPFEPGRKAGLLAGLRHLTRRRTEDSSSPQQGTGAGDW